MGQASASSSSSSAINATGGNISENTPNYVAWIVLGLVAMLGLLAWTKTRK